jgi:hypothetical protein
MIDCLALLAWFVGSLFRSRRRLEAEIGILGFEKVAATQGPSSAPASDAERQSPACSFTANQPRVTPFVTDLRSG